MIRNPLSVRLAADRPIRDQIHQAAKFGARGVVLEASGDLAPHRLGETGRRDLRHVLRSTEMALVALVLPTRRAFDSIDQLDDRIKRADAVFEAAFELGTRLVLSQVGPVPSKEEAERLEVYTGALASLAGRADHRGVRLGIEIGAEPGSTVASFLSGLNHPFLGASIDPPSLLRAGIDPVAATRELHDWLVHTYAGDATGGRTAVRNPRGVGYPPGALDWEEFVGSLEEIGYHGFLTIWPDPVADPAKAFKAVVDRVVELS